MDRQTNKFPLPEASKFIEDYKVSRYPAGDASEVRCFDGDGNLKRVIDAKTRKVEAFPGE